MAASGLLPAFRRLYAKAAAETDAWADLQARLVAQVSSAVNVLQRLPALANAATYGALAGVEGLPQRVHFKQLRALEALLRRVQSTLSEMDAAVQALGRLAQEAQRLAAGGSAGRPLPASAQFLRPGGEPCPAECYEGLQDLWHMHRCELALKHALVRAVSYATDPAELPQLQECLEAQPNIDAPRAHGLLYRVMCTEPLDK